MVIIKAKTRPAGPLFNDPINFHRSTSALVFVPSYIY